jgi:hypothetical protein
MAAPGRNHPDRHRHSQPPAPKDQRRRVLVGVAAVLAICAVVAVLVVTLLDRSGRTLAETPAARTTPAPAGPPTTAAVPMTAAGATSSEVVPPTFAEAMGQTGIPLDPQTGWVVAQGICVRLGQPGYDQFRMAEGVERLFPSVSDEQAHAFVAMVATTVCRR